MLTIREAIQKIVEEQGEIYSLVCNVTAVDEDKRTIDAQPINGAAEIFDIKLQAAESGGTGLVLIPEEESEVIVTFLSKDTAFVSLCTSASKILVNCDEIVFNDGDNGGLVLAGALADKLAAVETMANDLHTALLGIVVPLAPSGAYPFAPSFASILPIQPTTQQSDLENDKIKH